MDTFPLHDPETRELTGGDLLAQTLKQLGVTVAFGLHGGHLDAFLMGCESVGIRLIDTRHETVAVQAAEGYTKLANKVGVCFVTANSGFSNGLPGLATALADRSPILCLTSSPPMRDVENNSLQGIIDQVVAARPFTKFAHRMTNPEDIPRIISHAVRIAVSGAPGPVLVDFPIDVLFTPVHKPLISWGSVISPMAHAPGPNSGAIEAAIELIKAAKRPAIITGTGANSEEAASQLMQLSRTCKIPIFDTFKCRVAFIKSDFPLFAGASNNLGLLPLLQKQQPDLVLLIGARTGMFLGGRTGALIPNTDCKLIQVDVDAAEIGRTLPVHLGAVSDAAQFVQALNRSLDASPFQSSMDSSWLQDVLSLKHLPLPFEQEPETRVPSGRLHPYHAMKHLFASLTKDSIIILDGGEAPIWASDVVSTCSPRAVLRSTGNLGFLGNGFGYALGAALAAPGTSIINLHGDGSAGFHFMELDTFKRHNLNILTIVVNNYCWGMSSNGQDLVYGSKNLARPISALTPIADYARVAESLGNASAKVTTLEELTTALAKLEGQPRAACLEIIVDDKPIHPMTVGMVGQTEEPDMVVVPYYDNVPRAHYRG
ncbi:thiamine pyrophosphate enzyme, N-terminal TPP binding domain-containing protein [Aspergillus pseudoustus]|uniref:Thiamine pyrophosphate enzyme, N-terminal TPP binding domain-containing protein n=1 Tax=Aspergillus pseudoustus TaxID=1810923 RepID=A0ABR4K4C4_9EURO